MRKIKNRHLILQIFKCTEFSSIMSVDNSQFNLIFLQILMDILYLRLSFHMYELLRLKAF